MKKNTKFLSALAYIGGLFLFSAGTALFIKYRQGNVFHPTTVLSFLSIFLISLTVGTLAKLLIDKYEKYSPSRLIHKIFYPLLLFYLGTFLIANLVISLATLAWYLYSGLELQGFVSHLFTYELPFASKKLLLWLLLFTLAFFFLLWQKAVKREDLLLQEKLRYQYNNLKAQVNPHFLFNSLNTLSEMIHQDPVRAESFVLRFSSVYRYVLENEETELVSLDRELEFVHMYYALLQERDQGKVFLEENVPYSGAYLILPVSLQVLLENALKHNMASKEKPLYIRIFQEEDFLVISNNLQRKDSLEKSTGKGLENLAMRIKLLTDRELRVKESPDEFTVSLPVLQKTKNESIDH